MYVRPSPSLFVQLLAGSRESTFVPTGSGWTPKKILDILLLGEPRYEEGEVVMSSDWKTIGSVTTDDYGMFGFTGGALKMIVPRTIPGAPPQWLSKPVFLARERNSGSFRFFAAPNAPWFTFAP